MDQTERLTFPPIPSRIEKMIQLPLPDYQDRGSAASCTCG